MFKCDTCISVLFESTKVLLSPQDHLGFWVAVRMAIPVNPLEGSPYAALGSFSSSKRILLGVEVLVFYEVPIGDCGKLKAENLLGSVQLLTSSK